MDREVSKKQQTRHIYDGTVMRFSVRPSPKRVCDLEGEDCVRAQFLAQY